MIENNEYEGNIVVIIGKKDDKYLVLKDGEDLFLPCGKVTNCQDELMAICDIMEECSGHLPAINCIELGEFKERGSGTTISFYYLPEIFEGEEHFNSDACFITIEDWRDHVSLNVVKGNGIDFYSSHAFMLLEEYEKNVVKDDILVAGINPNIGLLVKETQDGEFTLITCNTSSGSGDHLSLVNDALNEAGIAADEISPIYNSEIEDATVFMATGLEGTLLKDGYFYLGYQDMKKLIMDDAMIDPVTREFIIKFLITIPNNIDSRAALDDEACHILQ